eukprot:4174725-Alexandrium_andersonii.AAC.1
MGRDTHRVARHSGESWIIGPKPSPRNPWSQHAQQASRPSLRLGNGEQSETPVVQIQAPEARAKRGASGARR